MNRDRAHDFHRFLLVNTPRVGSALLCSASDASPSWADRTRGTSDATGQWRPLTWEFVVVLLGQLSNHDLVLPSRVRDGPIAVPVAYQRVRRLQPDEVLELVSAYQAGGTTIQGMARVYGVSRTTVRDHLDRAGVPRHDVNCRLLSDEQADEAMAMRATNQSWATISRHFEVHPATVQRAIERRGG